MFTLDALTLSDIAVRLPSVAHHDPEQGRRPRRRIEGEALDVPRRWPGLLGTFDFAQCRVLSRVEGLGVNGTTLKVKMQRWFYLTGCGKTLVWFKVHG